MKHLFTTLFLIGIINIAISQNIEIKGKIMSAKTQTSIPYATVLLSKPASPNKVEYSAVTDTAGFFEIKIDNANKILLKVNMFGFDDYQKEIEIPANTTEINIGDIKLEQTDNKIDKIIVIRQKNLVKAEAGKLSYNTEADPDSQTSTVLEMMRKVPMISVDGDDNIKLRGSSSFKIYLNGKPSAMFNRNPKEALRMLPASEVEKIEVITTPGAKYDAEGVGGIINIVMKKATKISGYAGSVVIGANTRNGYNAGVSMKAAINKFVFSVDVWTYAATKQPARDEIFNENYNENIFKYINQKNEYISKYMTTGGYGSMSYEIDSLNLITASFDLFTGKYNADKTGITETQNYLFNPVQKYETISKMTSPFGDADISLDYQNISKKNEDRIFTLSYKTEFSMNPGEEKTDQTIKSIQNFYNSNRIMNGKSNNSEHTTQLDYVIPIKNIFKLETGLKYILRLHKNYLNAEYFDYNQNKFFIDSAKLMDFHYAHHIAAGYMQINGDLKKLNYKVGLRVEQSFLEASYKKGGEDFDNDNLEFVPSAALAYQINDANGISIAYAKRIQRPSFYYLNPSVNDLDPKKINFGNPKLKPEHFHSFDLNWNMSFKLGNINTGLSYMFGNDGITSIYEIKNQDVIYSTYKNLGKINKFGINENINLTVFKKINIFMNMSAYYTQMENNTNKKMKNNTWSGNGFMQLRYTIIKDMNLSGYAGMNLPSTSLQTKSSGYYFYGISLSKKFLDNKLRISIRARAFMEKEKKYTSKVIDDNFYSESKYYRPGRVFSLSIKYNFGELHTDVKRTRKTINNTDLKAGKSNNEQTK